MRYSYTKEDLQDAVSTSYSIAQCLKKLGIVPAGGNYSTIKQRFIDWEIDTTHFRGQGWNVGLEFKPNPPKPLEEILVKESRYQSYKLKLRLLEEGVKAHICEGCAGKTWQDQVIPLELHHIDGDKYNNLIENIQLLCPNCHALTDNYRGRNIRVTKGETL